MKMIIAVEFFNDLTPEEALASLATRLGDSVRWPYQGHGVIELRALTASVDVEPEALPNFLASAPVNVAEYDPDNQRRNRFQSFFPAKTCKG